MPRLLLEIGTEEIPPAWLPPAIEQLVAAAGQRMETARIAYGSLKAYATPRRLALIGEEVAERQTPAVREVRGPAAKAAFDAQNRPTRAAEGFARSQDVEVSALEVRETDQGQYVFAVIRDEGRDTVEVMGEILPEIIKSLSFPKSMRWGTGTLRFARPIRSLVALLGDRPIPFVLDGLRAGRRTRGHVFLSRGMVSLSSADDYESALEERFVLVDSDRRLAALREELDRISQQQGGRVVDDGSLTRETTFNLEFPTALAGSFDEDFLALPREILIQAMRKVQEQFPIEDAGGRLLPKFIAVRDGDRAHLDIVREGNERVLRARLIDAQFFYERDRQTPLADRVESLREVIWQEGLGTVYDKVQRVRRLASQIAGDLNLDEQTREHIDRAALLCKADLVTSMVTEYEPKMAADLQGLMGAEYARDSGEPQAVADAIAEHYRPRGADDKPPATVVGRVVALADKLDTLAACFSAGRIPTGTADPLGLRRDAQGVLAILIAADWHLSLSRLVREGREALFAGRVVSLQQVEQTEQPLLEFFGQRIAYYLDSQGVRYDLADAAAAVGFDDPVDCAARAAALQQVASDPAWEATVNVATRVSNILRGQTGGQLDPDLLTEPSERALWEARQQAAPEVEQLVASGDYQGLYHRLGAMRETIDRFFDDVLVMAPDEKVRANRLALVGSVNELFLRLGDFSKVVL